MIKITLWLRSLSYSIKRHMLLRVVIYLLLSSVLLVLGSKFYNLPKHALALTGQPQTCSIQEISNAGNLNEQQWTGNGSSYWNQTGYFYWTFDFKLLPAGGQIGASSYYNPDYCSADFPIDPTPQGSGSANSVALNNTTGAIDVRLGKPALIGGNAGSGKWRDTTLSFTASELPYEQVYRDVASGPGTYAGSNLAAFVDDAGDSTINGIPLFCINISNCPGYTANSQLATDINNVIPLKAHGAGAFMVADNNPDSKATDWYEPGSDNSIPNLPGRGVGLQNPINLHMDAESTWRPGMSVETVLTFKYPLTGINLSVDPVCSNKLVNGTITPAPGYNATVIATVDGVQSPIVTNNGVFSINMLDQNTHTVSANYNGLQSNTVTYGPCNQPPPPSGCTTLPNYPSPDVTVSLPDQTPYPQGGPPAYGFGSYTQNVPEGKTQVTSVNDISQGGIRVPPTKVSESYQSVTLDYTPYVQNYPYDNNQPSVNYNSYYDQYYYSASGPPVYNDYYTCDYYVANTGYYYDYATGAYDIPYTYYTCGNYTFHHDFLGYTFVQTGSAYGFTAAGTQNGPLMQYCYSRNFNLTGTSATNTYWSPSTENPTSVNFGSNVHADFTTSHGGIGVRLPLQVNTSVTANYYVRKASGQVIPYPVPGRCGGQYSTTSTNINVSDGYGTSGSADYPNTDCLNASIPPLQLGDVACFTITTSPTIGEVDPNGNTSGPRIGPVTLYARSTAPDQPGVSCTAPIINLPYTRMYGNDVFAGGGFAGNGNSCTTPGNLLGYLGGTASGTTDQLAAYAIGIINGFGSSQMVAPDAGLQFENTGGPPGYFTGSQCASDFMSQKPAASSSIPIVGNTLIWPLVSNGASAQSMSGTVLDIPAYTIPPADVSGKANKIALFVTGDVHITGNITIGGSWTVDKAPAFYLIVTGNIFIDPGVTQLDGVYVAQPVNAANPLASEARIYTCAANASLSAAVIFQSCANQLTVNGAFVAQQVKLQRTFGSLRDALANETPVGAPHNCSISSISGTITQQPVCAAEVFNFSPEIYIAQPPFMVKGNETFDAITSLPPVL